MADLITADIGLVVLTTAHYAERTLMRGFTSPVTPAFADDAWPNCITFVTVVGPGLVRREALSAR